MDTKTAVWLTALTIINGVYGAPFPLIPLILITSHPSSGTPPSSGHHWFSAHGAGS